MFAQRKRLTLEEKINIIVENETIGTSVRKLAGKYGVGKTQISELVKNKEYLKMLYNGSGNVDDVVRLEKMVFQCLCELRRHGAKITRTLISRKASEAARKLNLVDFTVSTSWIESFCSKNGITFRMFHDSMPLQQRLNTIVPHTEENQPPPLKSQPLSPTKLKVTRQSTSKSIQEVAPPPKEAPNEEVCLRWNSHHSNMQSAFPNLLSKEQYCDVTLVADGKSLKCHKLILSSCSSYFDQVLEKIMPYQHPVIFMKDIPFNILKSLCDFMYAGEVNILQGDLDQLLAVAESLKIKGLANKVSSNTTDPQSPPAEPKESLEHHQQKVKEAASSKFIKIAPKPTSSGVAEFKKYSPPKPGANGDVTDPLDLMEPTYEEEATVDVPPTLAPKRIEPQRRSLGKRVRKRKHVGEAEHESSPPVFQSRKGTRSRPNVKVPRYFNASFDNSNEKPAPLEAPEVHQEAGVDACGDPLFDLLEEIKTEPVDIEDSLIEESYEPVRTTPLRLTTVVTKQEKEDAPDPLNVEVGDERQHIQAEEDATEMSNSLERTESVEGHETETVEQLTLECSTNETDQVSLECPTNEKGKVTLECSTNEADQASLECSTNETDQVTLEFSSNETDQATLECSTNDIDHATLECSTSETDQATLECSTNETDQATLECLTNEAESVQQETLECSTNENMIYPEEENSPVVLSIAGTFSALEGLPENDTS